jgi:hypothetical protein
MKQSFTDRKGFSLKVSANHDLTSEYYFSSGFTATYLEWKRNTELHSLLSPTGPQEPTGKPMGDIIWRDADGISHPANFSTDPKIGKGSFIFVQIPVLVGRQFLKEKLQLKAGIMNSFLLSAREYQTEYSYMTGISVEKNSTASHYQAYSLGTVVEASFKLTQHLAVNASGQHNLTRIFKDNTSSLSKTRLSILSLGVEYYF